MKTLLISGSRNAHGQTASAVEAFCEGLVLAGASIERILLPALCIERCRQCNDDGWGVCRHGERCIIEDDLGLLTDKVASADLVVFATPVYWSDLSESLRAFLDRARRIAFHAREKSPLRGKRAFGICVAGGGGGGSYECARSLAWTLQSAGFDVVGTMPVRRQNLSESSAALREMGRRIGGKDGE